MDVQDCMVNKIGSVRRQRKRISHLEDRVRAARAFVALGARHRAVLLGALQQREDVGRRCDDGGANAGDRRALQSGAEGGKKGQREKKGRREEGRKRNGLTRGRDTMCAIG